MAETITLRGLNRAFLARQMLLERAEAAAEAAIERVLGLQGQEAKHPFVALWTRLKGFKREDLLGPIGARRIVRATWARATLHLVTRNDYLALRAAFQPVLTAAMLGIFKNRGVDLDTPPILAAARRLYGQGPMTFGAMRAALQAAFPGIDERMLGYAVRMSLALIVADEDTPFGFKADPRFGPAEDWLGAPPQGEARPEALLRRYLAGYGPATVADFQSWSGLAGQKTTAEALRGELAAFTDERGREMFDLPGAERPDEDVPAPPRLLAEFDTALLGHADRGRIVPERYRKALQSNNLRVPSVVLVDGVVAGAWKVAVQRGRAVATIQLFEEVSRADKQALAREAATAAKFLEPAAKDWDAALLTKAP